METPKKKRITMKLKHPNPLFEQWLTEWRDTAAETNSNMQYCFGKALQTLKKYPLPLESGRDCRILQGFGEKLCQMLDRKLAQHRQNPASTNITGVPKEDDIVPNKDDSDNQRNKRRSTVKNKVASPRLDLNTTSKEYIPSWHSGPYAIMITLYKKSLEPLYPGYMLKTDIIRNGQHLCDKSFVKPEPGSYYTAWSSMKTLLDKNLVVKRSSPAQFSLTDEGLVLAHKLYKNNLKENTDGTVNNLASINEAKIALISTNRRKKVSRVEEKNDEKVEKSLPLCTSTVISDEITSQTETESTCSSSTSQDETFIFVPHSFEIILLVDKQEKVGGSRNPLDDPIIAELTNLNVIHEARHLKVGDYTWICRQHITNKELVLPHIVERKRMDDFGSSIKDGRFHEQKFRLRQCAIQNVVYLIESYGNNTYTGLPITTLYQAATNTLLQDNFSVKFTNSLRGTAEYLASFTLILADIYRNKTLMSCPKQNLTNFTMEDDLIPLMLFNEFNKGASKSRNFKVRELFVRQLLQLKGMSVDRALAIVEKYPTPQLLQTAYNSNPNNVGEKLLSTIQFGKLGKKIGPIISRTIYQMYSNTRF